MKTTRIQKLLSYFWPIMVERRKNAYHTLEVEWNNGVLMLNSSYANYSFGNLHEVFVQAFRDSNLNTSTVKNVLILGLGGGSVLNILEKQYAYKGNITAVDIDSDVIGLYHKYFNTNNQRKLSLVHSDAVTFLENWHSEPFDLIIIDVFIDLHMPDFIYHKDFYRSISRVLEDKGSVYLNTIFSESSSAIQADLFYPIFKSVQSFEYFDMNRVFLLRMP